METPEISIVIPVFNQVQHTERCLSSILENSTLAREIIIVDNDSTDVTPVVLKTRQKDFESAGWRFQILTNPENRGFGRACNQGFHKSHGKLVVILNNDTWLMKGWDRVLHDRIYTHKADMISPYYDEKPYEEGAMPARAAEFLKRNQGKFANQWVSILMMFRRESFEKLGGFDERFFVTCEDADLRKRMDLARMRYIQTADCYIWHQSKGTRESGELPVGYETDALRKFVEKWGYDPRIAEASLQARLLRRWSRIKTRFGYF